MKKSTVGIAGAGTMGKQLALLFASMEIPVVIWNHRIQPNFSEDMARLAKIQARLGNISKEHLTTIMEFICYTNEISALAECGFVVEAVKEDKHIKREVLSQISHLNKDAKAIATNTSTLSITELGSFTEKPKIFLGVHFFNPPLSMKLVEVVKGELTSEETVDFIIQMVSQMNKHPVVLPEAPGFIVNRLLFPMINEAIFLLSEGVSDAKTIDNCLRLGANHPMGPLELADLIGLDICLSILKTLVDETGDGKYRPAPLLKRYVRAGRLGRKSGMGFHQYNKRN